MPEKRDMTVPRFPPPRRIEAPSPYRKGAPGVPDAPVDAPARPSVRRPNPPPVEPIVQSRSRWTPEDGPLVPSVGFQEPWGPLDRVLSPVRPVLRAIGARPHLVLLLVVALLCLFVAVFGRSEFHSDFV